MSDDTATRPGSVRVPRFGLSGKLLVLTILFVMIAEVLIYVPSVANFRVTWLKDRLQTGYTAALVLEAAPNGMVPDSLAKQILDSIGARAVAMKMGERRRMLAIDDMPPAVDDTFDMRSFTSVDAIVDAFKIMLNDRPYVMRVVGPAPMGGEYIELIMDERPLRRAMLRYSADILLLSLAISMITAALVYLSLHYMFVRPMRRVTGNMMAFRADPENADRIIVPSGRADEIGTAERELAAMQLNLASLLQQKNHLAALGLAVSKINHDLRNLLASSQLLSDQLASVPDPRVQRFAPKLMRSLERAIAFCQSTLSYGRAQEAAPDRHVDDGAGALHRVALADAGVLAEDHDADIVALEVERHALDAVLKLDHLAGLDLVEAVDAGDAVADRQHLADLGDIGLAAEIRDLLLQDGGDFRRADFHVCSSRLLANALHAQLQPVQPAFQ